MTEFALLVLTLAFGLLIRLAFTDPSATDEAVSFWLMERLSDRRWVTYRMDDSVVQGEYPYPCLTYFLVSKFPRSLWGLAGRVLNAGADLVTALVVYSVARWLTDMSGLNAGLPGLSFPLLAVLLFLTTPILLPVKARMRTIKGRAMGLTLATFYFVGLALWMSGELWAVGVVLASGLLVILSSQFALQVVLFFSPILALILSSWIPLLAVILVLALGWLDSGLGTRPVLRFMWHHKWFYLRNKDVGTTAAGRNRLRDFLLLPVHLVRRPRRAAFLIFKQLTPFIAAYSAPGILALAALMLTGAEIWPGAFPLFFVDYGMAVVLASIVVFALVSLPVFSFVGEAERYLQYSAPAVALLLPVAAMEIPFVLWLVLLVHLAGIGANLVFQKGESLLEAQPEIDPALAEVIDWMFANVDRGAVFTVPTTLAYIVSFHARRRQVEGLRFYYKAVIRPGETAIRYQEEDLGGMKRRPDPVGWVESLVVPSITPKQMRERYGVTHLLVNRGFLAGLERTWPEGEGWGEVESVFESERYVVLAVED